MTETALQNSVGISPKSLTTVATYAGLAGLMPLIPVPFVDDAIIGHLHRRLYQKLSSQHDFYLGTSEAKMLVDKSSNVLGSVVKSVLIWPVKKILKKVFYLLSIKACADVGTEVFHHGWLYARALEQRYIQVEQLARGDKNTIERLAVGLSVAHAAVDPGLTRQAMRTAFGLSRELARPVMTTLGKFLKTKDDSDLDVAEGQAQSLATAIEREIIGNWDLTPKLDAELRAALGLADEP